MLSRAAPVSTPRPDLSRHRPRALPAPHLPECPVVHPFPSASCEEKYAGGGEGCGWKYFAQIVQAIEIVEKNLWWSAETGRNWEILSTYGGARGHCRGTPTRRPAAADLPTRGRWRPIPAPPHASALFRHGFPTRSARSSLTQSGMTDYMCIPPAFDVGDLRSRQKKRVIPGRVSEERAGIHAVRLMIKKPGQETAR